MNWTLGFFRIWIVMAVCWGCLIIVLFGPSAFRPIISPFGVFELEFRGGTKVTVDLNYQRSELEYDIVRSLNRDVEVLRGQGKTFEAAGDAKTIEPRKNEILRELDRQNEQRSREGKIALAALIVPPLLLLIVGFLFAWIAKGFRSK